jgi:putative transposase
MKVVVMRRPVETARYVSIRATARLAEADGQPSVGSVVGAYDNSLVQTFDCHHKTEVFRRYSARKTKGEVKLGTLNFVSWFNE